jgi:muramoyltetrapeptide carboxypeptidase LdcA involved in peptidoglycan recycling
MISPVKLKRGDTVRVIAPSNAMGDLVNNNSTIALKRLEKDLGLKVSFGKHINDIDESKSSSINSRIDDFHAAFSDPQVKAIFAVMGGFNIISHNPKIFCGYSDITALNLAILSKTNVITYSGPVYATFSDETNFEYTLNYFKECLLSLNQFTIEPSKQWSDDKWYIDQNNRTLIKNSGHLIINKGSAEGTIIGTNLCTMNLLQGTEFFPHLTDSIMFLEDDYKSKPEIFDRQLQSLLHLPEFKNVRGLILGRFQKKSHISNKTLIKIIKTKKELNGIPIVANVDFGHTQPMITLPIGGLAKIDIGDNMNSKIDIIKH